MEKEIRPQKNVPMIIIVSIVGVCAAIILGAGFVLISTIFAGLFK